MCASKKVKITTYTVGQHFGTAGRVIDLRTRRTLHTTRVFPYGFNASAYSAAESYARSECWQLCE